MIPKINRVIPTYIFAAFFKGYFLLSVLFCLRLAVAMFGCCINNLGLVCLPTWGFYFR